MNQKKRFKKGQTLCNDASGWIPGMTIINANGALDQSSIGYDYALRTTTFLRKQVIEQKFYEIPVADFVPVDIGQGAWMEAITTNQTVEAGGEFESGIQGTHSHKANVPEVQAGIAPKTYPIAYWVKGYEYTLIQLNKAVQANNWDLIDSLHKALKRNWDLGIQSLAFLGLKSNASFKGLLTLTEPTVDTTVLTKNISELSTDEFKTFTGALLGLYAANCNYTVMPNRLVMPMDDYLGLAGPLSAAFPMNTPLEFLESQFKKMCGADFKIMPLAYCQKAKNAGYVSSVGSQRYVLYRSDPETVKLDIPVDFNLLDPTPGNKFHFNGVGIGAFTGLQNFRPQEVYYFEHTNS